MLILFFLIYLKLWGIFMSKTPECVIELSHLGSIFSKNKVVLHYQRNKIFTEKVLNEYKSHLSKPYLTRPDIVNEKEIKLDKDRFNKQFETISTIFY